MTKLICIVSLISELPAGLKDWNKERDAEDEEGGQGSREAKSG